MEPSHYMSCHVATSALIANVYLGISGCRINGAKLAGRGFARVALTIGMGPVIPLGVSAMEPRFQMVRIGLLPVCTKVRFPCLRDSLISAENAMCFDGLK